MNIVYQTDQALYKTVQFGASALNSLAGFFISLTRITIIDQTLVILVERIYWYLVCMYSGFVQETRAPPRYHNTLPPIYHTDTLPLLHRNRYKVVFLWNTILRHPNYVQLLGNTYFTEWYLTLDSMYFTQAKYELHLILVLSEFICHLPNFSN